MAAIVGHRGSVSRVQTRIGLADVSHIRMQVPLPETADELCAVAQDVKAEARDIRLGAQATEHEIKRLSASGELAKYRMVHFATHGVVAGQLAGTHEPGLILTPPNEAGDEDDGYLSASEIASLKLDADWVILSACNTAAGAATSAEALSGLARAFIYAQARTLLVSHWEVYSEATVKLITAAIREMTRDPKVGRAEAMRRAMLALIDKGEPHEAHPAYWAPRLRPSLKYRGLLSQIERLQGRRPAANALPCRRRAGLSFLPAPRQPGGDERQLSDEMPHSSLARPSLALGTHRGRLGAASRRRWPAQYDSFVTKTTAS
jgi:CHAT domain